MHWPPCMQWALCCLQWRKWCYRAVAIGHCSLGPITAQWQSAIAVLAPITTHVTSLSSLGPRPMHSGLLQVAPAPYFEHLAAMTRGGGAGASTILGSQGQALDRVELSLAG